MLAMKLFIQKWIGRFLCVVGAGAVMWGGFLMHRQITLMGFDSVMGPGSRILFLTLPFTNAFRGDFVLLALVLGGISTIAAGYYLRSSANDSD